MIQACKLFTALELGRRSKKVTAIVAMAATSWNEIYSHIGSN